MTGRTTPPRQPATFRKPGAPLHAAMGGLIAAAALAGAGFARAMIGDLPPRDPALIGLGAAGALVLAAGFLNAWRQPLLAVAPGRLTLPTFPGCP